MVDTTARPQKGLLGRVAGAVTERVVDVVDPDIVLDHVDLNALLDKIDLQRVLERVDLNPVLAEVDLEALLSRVDLNVVLSEVDLNVLLSRVDLEALLTNVDLNAVLSGVELNALLGRVDLNPLLSEVDLDPLLGKVDLNVLLAEVDVEALVRRSGIPEIVADSTSQLAGSTIDVVRRQIAALDYWINRAVDTLMRRPAGSVPLAPPGLLNTSSPAEVGGRREVTGHYAGPVGPRAGLRARHGRGHPDLHRHRGDVRLAGPHLPRPVPGLRHGHLGQRGRPDHVVVRLLLRIIGRGRPHARPSWWGCGSWPATARH